MVVDHLTCLLLPLPLEAIPTLVVVEMEGIGSGSGSNCQLICKRWWRSRRRKRGKEGESEGYLSGKWKGGGGVRVLNVRRGGKLKF